MYQLMLVLPKTIKKPSLIWGEKNSKICLYQIFLYYFLMCLLVKVYKQKTEMKSKIRKCCKSVKLSYILNCVPFSAPSLGKYSGRRLSWITWSLCFRTKAIRILVKTYKQKAGSSISRWLKKDTFFSLWSLGLTLISLSTSYIFFCVEEPWTSKESNAKKGFAGCGKSRNLAPHSQKNKKHHKPRTLPTWLAINSLHWQDVKMKVLK